MVERRPTPPKRRIIHSGATEKRPAIPPERNDPSAWYGNEGWDPDSWSGDEYILPQWAREYIGKRKRRREETSGNEDVDNSEE